MIPNLSYLHFILLQGYICVFRACVNLPRHTVWLLAQNVCTSVWQQCYEAIMLTMMFGTSQSVNKFFHAKVNKVMIKKQDRPIVDHPHGRFLLCFMFLC